MRYRAIFISDLHLGTPGCQARELLEFLRRCDSDYLGGAGRRYCLRYGQAFTTAFHPRFPEILQAALRIPLAPGYALFRLHSQPRNDAALWNLCLPVSLHVGRVSYEKNIDAFLALDPPGSEVVCGGALHDDLRQACHDALAVPRDQARLRALDFSWARSGELFVSHLVPARRQPILPDRAAALTTVMKVSSGG